ncbi:2-polyprenylphenol 6-hydroxylase [Paracoccus limosus]|uniref:2-polyprenylphenol 6-hydroxylase n=1 Tax=Paracoccus limosus TaxID=913252 RepID=A0A844H2Z6_9RHOB|nr:2-polyprenylphenol 6-hydroxylase [Paracoccus limosus]MTH33840.1 2-polyprenylphenol 6-hydroxylase [Paracoccus limosus]
MRGPHNIWRLIRTGATFERTGAMAVALDAVEAPRRVRIAARILGWPFAWLGYKGDPALPPVTRAITALGPAYIKFGQILSTRPDVVGPELAEQLSMLQDRLPPFDQAQARRIVTEDLGQPVEALFSEFSEPVAAASIAQVHRARRADTGAEVAVKVLRPKVEAGFRRDIDAFHFAAGMIERLSPSSRRLRPQDVVSHFESVVTGELDLRREAANASEFAENTSGDAGMQVPRPHWHLSSRRVLTSDWAEGIPMGDVAALRAAGHDLPALGGRVLQLFLRHALRDGFFHADMHQGNLKVAANGDVVIYDFGIMGEIDEYTRRVYAEILMGFIRRDYMRVARVHFEAGYVPRDRDMTEFARALRAVGEPIFGADASRISMANLLAYLFEVTERFGMRTRTELILLQRTMVVVEGVARSLDSQINMWEVARPVVESYIRDNLGPRAAIHDLGRSAQVLARFAPLLPEFLERRMPELLRETPAEAAPRRSGFARGLVCGAAIALASALIGAWLA